uniref:Reverse transcriptase domain-containing protein n=1 Tax=Tanacetum cinerariifolium TaxID=118510 RepID=A0A6L2NVL6_TANCI|nr:hypothetical protein [Tanacetum cinerariifolium]
MHNYHLDRGSPRCAFKVDIQKAYDTVDWDFLRMILHGFGFHDKMVSWIMECVTTSSYSICVNGSLYGYFKGKRGLRQGDPLSLYLFTLVVEILTLMLHRKVKDTDSFSYHRYCSKLEIINLCFADDLFLFAYGDVDSASIIKEALDEFKNASGLVPSLSKSTAYFYNVLNHVKLSILQALPFEEGKLPVKYLGVPLVSSHLMIRDCNEFIDKVQIRIQDWKNKALSIVGKGKSKIAWESVCLPKDKGGLGIRRLECFNAVIMASHIWKIISLKESLWVKWIHEYKLKGRNFKDFPLRGNMSWGWWKILQLRPTIRRFILNKIGNGANTFLWFDRWTDLESTGCFVVHRDMARAGLTPNLKVHDVIINGTWLWPHDLIAKFLVLNNYNVPINDEDVDRLVWRDIHGNVKKNSVSQVWDDIRFRDSKVNWYNMVWFPSCIPRHAINLWLIVRRKLKTQDLIPAWDVSSLLGVVCSLCESNPDLHDHLFFECPVSCGIWNRVKGLAGLNALNPDIYDIIQDLLPIVKHRTTVSVIAKLVVAASAYYVWQERNWRLFKKGKRNSDQIVECIVSSVRLKLLCCKLKKSKSGERMARLWDLLEVVFI